MKPSKPARRVALFTIASKNYLSYVRVLMKSVAAVHPDYKLYLCLVDRAAPELDAGGEPYRVVQADEIGIPTFDDMALRYDVMELNTSVKPYMIRWLFDRTGADAVIYLDPDTRVYSRLSEVEARFDRGDSMVLTPHITQPLEDGKSPNDHHILQSGVFNLGFIAVQRHDESLRFVDWWARRLATQGLSDVKNNLFTDQRWCDFAPCFVDGLGVLKHPGYNIAYWNLAQRTVARKSDGSWTVNGQPLAFFHFSGVNIARRDSVSKHQDRFTWQNAAAVRPLFDAYFDALVQEGIESVRRWPYSYGRVGNVPLVPPLRQLYRQMHPQARTDGAALSERELVAIANGAEPRAAPQEGPRVTRLMRLIHDLRPDLQAVFSLGTVEGRTQYLHWFRQTAKVEYGLPDSVIPAPAAGAPTPREDVPTPLATPSEVTVGRLARSWRALPPAARRQLSMAWRPLLKNLLSGTARQPPAEEAEPADPDLGTIDRLFQPAPIRQWLEGTPISRLMHIVWQQRADLQSAFDLGTAGGQQQYIDWYRVAAPAEYGPHVALPEKNAPRLPPPAAERGANLVGYGRAEIGLGEHVRSTAAALRHAAVPFGMINLRQTNGRENAELDHNEVMAHARFGVNLMHINADQMLHLFGQMGPALFAHRYNVGYWAWELARWPAAWVPLLDMVNEVWAATAFIRDAIAPVAKVPVRLMPQCVRAPVVDARLDHAYFGLDEHAFHFLFTFDFASYMERKNPLATVRAFRRAFPHGTENVRLVLKTMNVNVHSAGWRRLAEATAEDPRIVVLDKTMNHTEVIALCAACDAFVSLHRSEGLGRGLVEAMHLGKPLIATGYSGNADFTREDTACVVGYRLVPVAEGAYPMHEGQVWADADVEHAAWHMRRLVEDPAQARELARAGQAFVQRQYGEQEVGRLYAKRLGEFGLLGAV